MAQLPLVPYTLLNDPESPTLTRVQDRIAASFKPLNTSPFLNGTYFQAALNGATLGARLPLTGPAFLATGATTAQGGMANITSSLDGTGFPGIQIRSAGTFSPILDFGRAAGRTDWRITQDGTSNNLNITPFNAGVGKLVDVQAPIRSSRGLLMSVGPFVYWDSAGSNNSMNVASQNITGGVVVSIALQWVPQFSGSVIAVSGVYEVANANAARVDIVRSSSGTFSTTNVTPSATPIWRQTYTKGTIPFIAGEKITLNQIFSSGLNQRHTVFLTVEMDP